MSNTSSTLHRTSPSLTGRPRRASRVGLPARVLRGRPGDPRWVRPSLLVLLLATGALYLWNLSASDYANSFYAAAVQAGTHSWKAFFFGSFDAANAITVDKPPASLWVMELSGRLFGFSSWSMLVPQAVEGVVATGLLYATVRRQFPAAAGLLAGAIFALTPVSALMFRFNNPDALLVLLLVAAAYAVMQALEAGRARWMVLAGTLLGLAFLTKMLQAFLVLPAFAVVHLLFAHAPVRRRIGGLLAGGVALCLSAGWWIATVALWPASARPYIGGSQHNSILELTLGYNGFGRLTGNETGSVGGGPAGTTGRWGATGLLRLFNTEMGGQVSWLLPAALLVLAGALWLWRRRPRRDLARAQLLLWAGWLLVTGAVFSFAQGIIHPYYTVALAPAIGAIVGIGAVTCWQHRGQPAGRLVLSAATAATTVWAVVLLARTPDWHPWLRIAVAMIGSLATAGLALSSRLRRRLLAAAAAAALVAVLAGPAAYSAQTAATAHTGAIPSAGPAVTGRAGPPGLPGRGRPGNAGGGIPPASTRPGAPPQPGAGPSLPNGAGGPFAGGGAAGPGRAARGGGLLDAATPDSALVRLLKQDAGAYTWVAATVGANSAAGIQLATGQPVMAIGGFNGTDPSPTLAQFKADVAQGRIHVLLAGGTGPGAGAGGSGQAQAILDWVQQRFPSTTVGGQTVYDLSGASASTSL